MSSAAQPYTIDAAGYAARPDDYRQQPVDSRYQQVSTAELAERAKQEADAHFEALGARPFEQQEYPAAGQAAEATAARNEINEIAATRPEVTPEQAAVAAAQISQEVMFNLRRAALDEYGNSLN